MKLNLDPNPLCKITSGINTPVSATYFNMTYVVVFTTVKNDYYIE